MEIAPRAKAAKKHLTQALSDLEAAAQYLARCAEEEDLYQAFCLIPTTQVRLSLEAMRRWEGFNGQVTQ